MEWWKNIKNSRITRIEKCVSMYKIFIASVADELEFDLLRVLTPYITIKTYEDQHGKYRARTDTYCWNKKTGQETIFEALETNTEQEAIESLLSSLFKFIESAPLDDYEFDWLPYRRL